MKSHRQPELPLRSDFKLTIKRKPLYEEQTGRDLIGYLGLGAIARNGLRPSRLAKIGIDERDKRSIALEEAIFDLLSSLVPEGILVEVPGPGGGKKKRPVRKIVCKLVRRRVKKGGGVECLYRCSNGGWITKLRGKGKECDKSFTYNVPA